MPSTAIAFWMLHFPGQQKSAASPSSLQTRAKTCAPVIGKLAFAGAIFEASANASGIFIDPRSETSAAYAVPLLRAPRAETPAPVIAPARNFLLEGFGPVAAVFSLRSFLSCIVLHSA